MNIDELGVNDKFKVLSLRSEGEIGRRLSSMGFARDTEGIVVRSALVGDPIQVKILGYDVTIRRSEAKCVEVERLN